MDIRRAGPIETVNRQVRDRIAHESYEEVALLESRDSRVLALLEAARRVAASDATVLLTGESGTGKDVLARQIHEWSQRRNGPFVVINCVSLADQLLENDLFGHVRGAFTGAVSDTRGRLEAAESGTIVLDEIAELPSPLQARFLRFIQEQSFERIGSNRTVRVNVRIIAASNRDLEAEVAAGRFREDLFYRLNVIGLRVPPLRERMLDILPLAEWMLKQSSLKANHPEFRLSTEAAEALTSYRWPGNVRELRNALEHAIAVAHTEMIALSDLPDRFCRGDSSMFLPSQGGAALKDREREYILRVMAESSTLASAAARLGINTTTLWRKRKRYGIE